MAQRTPRRQARSKGIQRVGYRFSNSWSPISTPALRGTTREVQRELVSVVSACSVLKFHRQGENIKFIQKQLRHTTIQQTMDVYGHLFPEAHRDSTKRLDAFVWESAKLAEP